MVSSERENTPLEFRKIMDIPPCIIRSMTRLALIIISMIIAWETCILYVYGEESGDTLNLTSPSAILMESSTGQIIYEKNSNERVAPASITKIMTLLLIFDALQSGSIKLDEDVTVSEHAASMGGEARFIWNRGRFRLLRP